MRIGQWLDDRPLTDQWSQPVRPFRLPRWAWVLGILVLLAAIIAAVFGAGGFEARRDLILSRQPGSVLEIGPYEIVVHHAEVQRIQEYDDTWYWEYRVIGSITNTWHESVSFRSGEFGWIAFREPRSGEIVSPNGFRTSSDAVALVPATGAPMAAEWWERMESEPSAYLLVGFLDLEYTDNSLLGFGSRVWNPTDLSYQVWVPVIRLPDQPRT